MKNFKKGDQVVMHTCHESEIPEYAGKLWTCRTDSYMSKGGDEVVFLDGFSGYFICKYLQLVKVPETKPIPKEGYYIRTQGFIGNGLVWWRPNSAGYSSDIKQAGIYSYEEAHSICKGTHGDNLAYKCSTIDNMPEGLILQVHSDYVPKPDIGTVFGEEIE